MQVGNAVPIYLATAVLSSFCKYFSQIAPKKKNINALSLFCGAGGMDIGADNASYKNVRIKTRLSSDIWEDACQSLKTYYKNVNNSTSNVITADISKIDNPTEFWKQNTKSVELDMIYGGPPCQAFSQAGKQKGTNDIRGTMVFQYLRVVGDLKPKAFLIENVSNLKGINGGQIMRDILKLIDELGYNCNVQLLSAHHYGAPQKRKRIFFMCSQKGTPSVETPKETNYDGDMYALPFNTVAKAFSGLPPATCISEDK